MTLATISWVNAQNVVPGSTIIDRLDKILWVSVPVEYSAKLLDFVLNDTIMRTRSATAYTEEFIVNEMQKDRLIDKQNQLLFIWSIIYEQISWKYLYNREYDENENRVDDYWNMIDKITLCENEYKKWFKTYMEMWIAEAIQQSAVARQRSADALNSSLENLVWFYNRYKKDSSTIKDEEVKQRKWKGKEIIQRCKEVGIDYKSKLSKEMLKFYGVE